jgi:hypothetical protein
MNQTTKLLFALQQVEGISKLMKDNEYEHYLNSFLVPINVELRRQLTCLQNSAKIKE